MQIVPKVTQMDSDQIIKAQHDEVQSAQRVVIIGGEIPSFNVSNRQSLEQIKIEVPKYIDRVEYKEIEKPVYIDRVEYKEIVIEKPVYIDRVETKIEYKEIQVPHIVIQKELVEMPVQVSSSPVIQNSFPKWAIACVVLQAISSLIMVLAHFVK